MSHICIDNIYTHINIYIYIYICICQQYYSSSVQTCTEYINVYIYIYMSVCMRALVQMDPCQVVFTVCCGHKIVFIVFSEAQSSKVWPKLELENSGLIWSQTSSGSTLDVQHLERVGIRSVEQSRTLTFHFKFLAQPNILYVYIYIYICIYECVYAGISAKGSLPGFAGHMKEELATILDGADRHLEHYTIC